MYELFDDAGLSQKIKNIAEFKFAEEIKKRNAKYLESEKNKYKNLFVNAKGNELTEKHKNAIITLEDRNLLIAAAGSGKTETMLYKLKYVLKKGLYEPEQILLLAFNKKVREELIKRAGLIGTDLGKGNIHTFNSFGLSVINKSGNNPVSVADENFANRFIRFIRKYASVNKKFFGYYVEFVTLEADIVFLIYANKKIFLPKTQAILFLILCRTLLTNIPSRKKGGFITLL